MMEQALVRVEVADEASSFHSVDTSIVLFFLAMELAASAGGNGLDQGLSLLAIAAFAVLPYFLPGRHETMPFTHWLAGRTAIALVGAFAGIGFAFAVAPAAAPAYASLPMTLLIFAAFVSCLMQLYVMMKSSLAR